MTSPTTTGSEPHHLEGRSVRDVVETDPAAVDEVWCRRIFRQILQSLELQHAMHLPRRWITPDTIVFHRNGEPLLLADDLGPPGADVAEDLTALARVIHFAITQELAPGGPLRGRADGYSDSLIAAVDACMDADPARRPHSIAAVRELLGIVALGPLPEAPPELPDIGDADATVIAAATLSSTAAPAPVSTPPDTSALEPATLPSAPAAAPAVVPAAAPASARMVAPVSDAGAPPQPVTAAPSMPAAAKEPAPVSAPAAEAEPASPVAPPSAPAFAAVPASRAASMTESATAAPVPQSPSAQTPDAAPSPVHAPVHAPVQAPRPASTAGSTSPPPVPRMPSANGTADTAAHASPRRGAGLSRWQRWAIAAGGAAALIAIALVLFAELRDSGSYDHIVLTLPQTGDGSQAARAPQDAAPAAVAAAPAAVSSAVPAPADGLPASDGSTSGPTPGTGTGTATRLPDIDLSTPAAGTPAAAAGAGTGATAGTAAGAAANAAANAAAMATQAGNAYKVQIAPWGVVYVDGVDRGVSPPVKRLVLAPGRHTVRVTNPNFQDRVFDVDSTAGDSRIAVDFGDAGR